MSVDILGGQEVPTELLGHVLSYLAGDDPTPWVCATMAVSRTWRAVTLQLLRAYAAEVLSALPPPCSDFAYAPYEGQEGKEGNILYAWRHDDKRDPTPASATDEEDDGEWWLAYVHYQLVAISEVDFLPHVEDGQSKYEETEEGFSSEDALNAEDLWSVRPWAVIFRHFISRGCPPQMFEDVNGPVAAMIWLLVLASDARRTIVLSNTHCEGHPFIQRGHEDVQLFFTLRHTAPDWLPWLSTTSPPAPGAASVPTSPRSRFVRVHLRNTLHKRDG